MNFTAKLLQLCLTMWLWTIAHQAPLSMGIHQARTLEWATMPSSRGSSQPRDRTHVSRVSRIGRRGALPLVPPGRSWFNISNATICYGFRVKSKANANFLKGTSGKRNRSGMSTVSKWYQNSNLFWILTVSEYQINVTSSLGKDLYPVITLIHVLCQWQQWNS